MNPNKTRRQWKQAECDACGWKVEVVKWKAHRRLAPHAQATVPFVESRLRKESVALAAKDDFARELKWFFRSSDSTRTNFGGLRISKMTQLFSER
jgi:hypothetical protein